jgi:TolB protein
LKFLRALADPRRYAVSPKSWAIPAIAIVIAVAAAGCGGSDTNAPSTRAASKPAKAEKPSGRIAFRRYFDAGQTHGAIFTINADGTGEKQVTNPPAGHVDDHPDWSPDGRKIAFQRCAEGEPCGVLIVDAGGGPARKLEARCKLSEVCDLAYPAWTPDGRIVATMYQGEIKTLSNGEDWIQQAQLELFDLRNGTQRTILARRNWTGEPATPAVSPDGRTILYNRYNSPRSKPAGGRGMFAINLDGTNHHQVAPWELGSGDHPGFAPDGTILFRSYEGDDSKQSDFWTVRLNGKHLRQLTHYEYGTIVLSASYSPDGKWIVHATNGVGGYADVFIMRADGTGNRPVTRTEQWDSAPDWSPAS